MAVMIHSKYGYEPPEWVQADSRLDKWCKDKKRRTKQHGAFNLEKLPVGLSRQFFYAQEKS
ncbi:hypothetical protein [Lactiplantibacillus plantarum]|uniref:hypothetical protein n=1 Tax=Lactiplantibacillus plantarum TaxID=1590 RepID=UPI00071791A2|nr:hypothetical protein [Lactiplantibacillus plantarum]KRU20047.1 hypothetical protein ASU25_04810 [Lactiplantibacillus plantarum]CAB1719566.1 hypothetical protein LAP9491_00424 [Lactiplantibacillus plantarum]